MVSSRVSVGTEQAWSPASSPVVFHRQGTKMISRKPTNHLNVVERAHESLFYCGSKPVLDLKMNNESETVGSSQSNPSPKATADIRSTSFQQNETKVSSQESTSNPQVIASATASDGYSNRRMKVSDIKPTNHLIGVLEKEDAYDKQYSVDQLINENRLLKLNIDSSKKII